MSTLEQVKPASVRTGDGGIRGWLENTRTFFTEVRNETRRVTWPSRREVYATTLVVIMFLPGGLWSLFTRGMSSSTTRVTPLRREDLPSARATRREQFRDQLMWVGAEKADQRALSVSAAP